MDLREIKYGIEIETIGQTRQRVAKAIQTVVGGAVRHRALPACYDPWEVTDLRGRTWKVVADASLSALRNQQAEVVSPILEYRDLEQLQEVVRAIRKAGAQVNDSCGIHIHVDAAPFDGRKLANLAKMVYANEPLLYKALEVGAHRQNCFTKPVNQTLIDKIKAKRPSTKDELNEIWYGWRNDNPTHYDSTRYHGLNLHNVWYRGTVEFRYFESTLHAGKIKAYIQLCLAMAAKALNAKSAAARRREYSTASAKFDFRCWLLRLGLIGDEFKTARLHLLAKMPGNASWKNGRPRAA